MSLEVVVVPVVVVGSVEVMVIAWVVGFVVVMIVTVVVESLLPQNPPLQQSTPLQLNLPPSKQTLNFIPLPQNP